MLLSLVFSNGCAMMDQSENPTPSQPEIINNALPFTDVPVPTGFSRDQLKSFVYESGNNQIKVGRLFFNGNKGLEPIVEFYQNEMINKGWTLVNSIASTETILNYQKEGWVCTIIIRPRSFRRSIVEVQIGPVKIELK
jgi:hypothetical protein